MAGYTSDFMVIEGKSDHRPSWSYRQRVIVTCGGMAILAGFNGVEFFGAVPFALEKMTLRTIGSLYGFMVFIDHGDGSGLSA
jgi:hypothetical protein